MDNGNNEAVSDLSNAWIELGEEGYEAELNARCEESRQAAVEHMEAALASLEGSEFLEE